MNVIRTITAWFTGILFMVIFFPVTFFIWLAALPFDSRRTVIHRVLVFQCMILVRILPVLSLRIEQREKAQGPGPFVIISNHQSLIDIIVMNCLNMNFKWISKAENKRVPVLGWYLMMADYITVDRKDDESKAEMLARSYACLKRGISVMIFPEGTRSANLEIAAFKRGAFQLAIDAHIPILPVVIEGTGSILPKKGIIFRGKGRILLRVLDPVLPGSFGTTDPFVLAAGIQAKMKETLGAIRAKERSL